MKDQDILTEVAILVQNGLRMAQAIHAVAVANGMSCHDVQELVNVPIMFSVSARFALGVC